MSDINMHCFTGRIVRDPELKMTTNGTPTCTISLAVEKGFGENKKTLYPTIVLWRSLAEYISKFRKGTLIAVECEYDERSWSTSSGEKRRSYEFIAKSVRSCEPKGSVPAGDAEDPLEDLRGDLPF